MRGHIRFLLWGLLLLGVDGCTPALPPGPLRIQITGEEYTWQFRYPGPDGELQTDDDITKLGKELHLPLGMEVEIELTSRDYIYTFALPHLDLHQVAVPDLTFALVLPHRPPAYSPLSATKCAALNTNRSTAA